MSKLAAQAEQMRQKQTSFYTNAERTTARNKASADLKTLHEDEFQELYQYYLANPVRDVNN